MALHGLSNRKPTCHAWRNEMKGKTNDSATIEWLVDHNYELRRDRQTLENEIEMLKDRCEKLWRHIRTSHTSDGKVLKHFPKTPKDWNEWFDKNGRVK